MINNYYLCNWFIRMSCVTDGWTDILEEALVFCSCKDVICPRFYSAYSL